MMKPYKMAAINTTKAEFFTVFLTNKLFAAGMKVIIKPSKPKPINTELLFKLLLDPVWYLRLIKPMASKA